MTIFILIEYSRYVRPLLKYNSQISNLYDTYIKNKTLIEHFQRSFTRNLFRLLSYMCNQYNILIDSYFLTIIALLSQDVH